MVAIWHDGYRGNIVVVAWKHSRGLTVSSFIQNTVTSEQWLLHTLARTMHCSDALKPLKVPQLDAHIS